MRRPLPVLVVLFVLGAVLGSGCTGTTSRGASPAPAAASSSAPSSASSAPSTATRATTSSVVSSGPSGSASPGGAGAGTAYTLAVIGDLPYGPVQLTFFRRWLGKIDAAAPRLTVHVGDIKMANEPCSDDRYTRIRDDFDSLRGPLVYTPGDNEWLDCRRKRAGRHDPLERLDHLREVFFTPADRTRGAHPLQVTSQAARGVPENLRWSAPGVRFASVHVVGGNDGLEPWAGEKNAKKRQVADEKERMSAAVANVRAAFAEATRDGAGAVVILQQADMFSGSGVAPTGSAFVPLVRALGEEAARFAGRTYLVNGDTHRFVVDRPLRAGSPWLSAYGVGRPADRLTRITVDGAENATGWLRITVRPGASKPLSWVRVPYGL